MGDIFSKGTLLWIGGIASSALLLSQGLAMGSTTSRPISVSSSPILDELIQNQTLFPEISRDLLLGALTQGDLLDIGESHEAGVERTYLANLYSDLATRLTPAPVECLVESSGTQSGFGPGATSSYVPLVKFDGPDDPLYPQFEKVCPESRMFTNPTDDYTNELAEYTSKGRVLTHTGLRHMLPWALMYPQDFPSPQWVDIPPHGTINRQLPSSFDKSGKQIRAYGNLSEESLIMPELTAIITNGKKAKRSGQQIAQAVSNEASKLAQAPALAFSSGEQAHIFEVVRVNQSFPDEHAYLALIHHPEFDKNLLEKLAASPEMASFIQQVDPSSLRSGVFISNGNEALTLGNGRTVSEDGAIYFTGDVAGTKGAKSIDLMVTPTTPPQLVYDGPQTQ